MFCWSDCSVEHYPFSSWMSLGTLGGIMFVVYGMHVLFMFVIRCCVDNDAVMLGGKKQEYDTLN